MKNNTIFDSIRHIDEFDNEYWLAREFMFTLDYNKWQKFKTVILKSIQSCEKSGNKIDDHFTQVGKMVDIGSKTKREILDINYHVMPAI